MNTELLFSCADVNSLFMSISNKLSSNHHNILFIGDKLL